MFFLQQIIQPILNTLFFFSFGGNFSFLIQEFGNLITWGKSKKQFKSLELWHIWYLLLSYYIKQLKRVSQQYGTLVVSRFSEDEIILGVSKKL